MDNNEGLNELSKRGILFFIGTLIVLLFIGIGGYKVYATYLNAQGQQSVASNSPQQQTATIYKEDIYGGSAPKETLMLFVQALRDEDLQLASKFFTPDDVVTREKWVNYLTGLQRKGLLNTLASKVETSLKSEANQSSPTSDTFILKTNSTTEGKISMHLDETTKIWKIESF